MYLVGFIIYFRQWYNVDDSKTKDYVDNNSTLSPRITDSSPRILKWKIIRIKTMFLKPRGAKGPV